MRMLVIIILVMTLQVTARCRAEQDDGVAIPLIPPYNESQP